MSGLDDRELDAMFVEAVDEGGFGESSSWRINSSPGKTRTCFTEEQIQKCLKHFLVCVLK